jgi:hypothetical protein
MLFQIKCDCGHAMEPMRRKATVCPHCQKESRVYYRWSKLPTALIIALTAMLLIVGSARAEEDTPDNPHCPTACKDAVFGRWIFKSGFDLCLVDQPCDRKWWIEAKMIDGSQIGITCSHNQYELSLFPSDHWVTSIVPGRRMKIGLNVLPGDGPLTVWSVPITHEGFFSTEIGSDLVDAIQRSRSIQFWGADQFPVGISTAPGLDNAISALKMACR